MSTYYNFSQIRAYVLMRFIPERKIVAGTILAFTDDRYAQFEVQSDTLANQPGLTTENAQGMPYDGPIEDAVLSLLQADSVVGFGLGSQTLYAFLQHRGTFELDENGVPMQYTLENRVYEVF